MLSFTDPFTHVLIECLLYVLGIKDPEVGARVGIIYIYESHVLRSS